MRIGEIRPAIPSGDGDTGKPDDGVPEKEPAKLDGKWERTSRQATARFADWDTPGGQTFAFFIIGVNSKRPSLSAVVRLVSKS